MKSMDNTSHSYIQPGNIKVSNNTHDKQVEITNNVDGMPGIDISYDNVHLTLYPNNIMRAPQAWAYNNSYSLVETLRNPATYAIPTLKSGYALNTNNDPLNCIFVNASGLVTISYKIDFTTPNASTAFIVPIGCKPTNSVSCISWMTATTATSASAKYEPNLITINSDGAFMIRRMNGAALTPYTGSTNGIISYYCH